MSWSKKGRFILTIREFGEKQDLVRFEGKGNLSLTAHVKAKHDGCLRVEGSKKPVDTVYITKGISGGFALEGDQLREVRNIFPAVKGDDLIRITEVKEEPKKK